MVHCGLIVARTEMLFDYVLSNTPPMTFTGHTLPAIVERKHVWEILFAVEGNGVNLGGVDGERMMTTSDQRSTAAWIFPATTGRR
jgi:hypothetical protein